MGDERSRTVQNRGVTKVKTWARVSAWGLLALACALLVACGGGGGDESADATEFDPEELRAFLDRAIEAFNSQESFHFTMDFDGKTTPLQGFPVEMRKVEGDIIIPDQLRSTIDAKAPDFGGINVTMKVIAIGEDAWMTSPFDQTQWLVLETGNPLKGLFDPSAGVADVINGAQNPHVTGEELINEIDTWRIEGVLDSGDLTALDLGAVPGYELQGTVWIGKEDGIIYRIHVLGQLHENEPADILRRLDFTNFREVEPIEPPQ